MKPLTETVRSLGRRLETRTREIQKAARGSAAGGDAAWDAVLSSLEIPAPSATERKESLARCMPLQAGALPIEVRRAMEAVHAEFSAEASRLAARVRASDDPDLDDAALDELLAGVLNRLQHLVDDEVKRYVQAVRPASPSGSEAASAVACRICDTPREAGTLESCACCGFRFP